MYENLLIQSSLKLYYLLSTASMNTDSLQKSAPRTSLDAIAVLLISLTGLLLPVLFIPSDLFSFGFTKTAIFTAGVGVTLIVWILARLKRGNFIFPPFIPTVAIWLVPVAYIFSGIFSGVGLGQAFGGVELEVDTAGFMIVGATALSLTALLLRKVDDVKKMVRFLGYMLGAVYTVQIIVLLLSTGVFGASVQLSPLGSAVGSVDDLALLAGLGAVGSMLALSTLSFEKRTRYALIALLGVSLTLLALYNATTIWFGVGIVALGVFIASIAGRRNASGEDLDGAVEVFVEEESEFDDSTDMSVSESGVTTTLALPVLILSLFFVVGSSTIGAAATSLFGTDQIVVRPSWQATLDIGRSVYDQSLFFGSGPGTFSRSWQQYRSADINQTIFWNTNFGSGIGFIPTSFTTTGLFGLLSWVIFFGIILFFGARSLFRNGARRSKEVQFIALLAFIATVYLWVAAFLFVPGPVVLGLAFLVTGIFVAALRFDSDREMGILFARSPRLGFVLVFLLTIVLLVTALGMYEVAKRYLSSVSYNNAVVSLVRDGDFESARAALARSYTYMPNDRALRLLSAIGIQDMVNLAQNESLPQDEARTQFQNVLAGAVEAGILATQFDQNNSANWIALGNVYQTVVPLQVEGAYDNAKLAYERARTLAPMNPELLLILAQLEVANENLDGAREYLTEAINLKNDYTGAIFLLSQIEVQQGRTEEALAAAEAAAFFEPQNPVVLFQVGVLRSGSGDTEGAIRAFEQAVFRDPGYANARYFLGASLASIGNTDAAVEQFRAIASLSEENAEAVSSVLDALLRGENPFPANTSPIGTSTSVPLPE